MSHTVLRYGMKRLFGVCVVALLLSASGCGAAAPKGPVSTHVTLTVFADDSLKGAFTEIGNKFEEENDDVTVKFDFAGSAELVSRIKDKAPGDVFAPADIATMAKVADDGLITGSPAAIAKNTLEIATPPGNPAGVNSFDDLTSSNVKVVFCIAEAPCGAAAHTIARAEGITIDPISREQSVTAVLDKVISGDADAGLVFVTDVKAAGDKVNGVEFPESSKAVNTYPIAALGRSKHVEDAKAFVEFVTSAEGLAILADAGFEKP